MMFDTHFHLDLLPNMNELIRNFPYVDCGVIGVGTIPRAYEKELKFTKDMKNIHVALGLHPQLVGTRESDIDLFLNLLGKTRFVGEIGLDFKSAFQITRNEQVDCFVKITNACAKEGNKVLSIHSVKAASVVLGVLEAACAFQTCACIFHWFTGSAVERERAIQDGAYFSINPKMLKTNSGKETIKAIPADKILLETDAPFAIPVTSVSALQSELQKLVIGISSIKGKDVSMQIEKNTEDIINFGTNSNY